ncbi:MAG: glycosyltransferase family 2 protein [Ignavibacteriaceae bacterium]|nr:glycosyltransferase family 2 protein [Ignavibacteriaceae bacterium]
MQPDPGQYEVSVILAFYNRAKYLERCINSLVSQSFKNWELIGIDDGSEDNSFEVLETFQKSNSNIRLFRQQNMKLPLSRNRGIKESSGRYITFLDSDDEYLQDHLLKRVEFMAKHPEVDLIHGGVEIIGNEYVRDKNNPNEFIHLSQCTIGATFFGKRNVFTELNGFKNLEYSEDSEFLERAKTKFKIEKVNFNTYRYYRDAPDSITNSFFIQ